jgi:methylmalonyl-CoA mutase cobalamin-binding subunit
MAKSAHRRTVAVAQVFTLTRRQGQQVLTLGQFSTAKKAMGAAEQTIKDAAGLSALARLRLDWTPVAGAFVLDYGRDAHDFRFRVEPWPVDAES